MYMPDMKVLRHINTVIDIMYHGKMEKTNLNASYLVLQSNPIVSY